MSSENYAIPVRVVQSSTSPSDDIDYEIPEDMDLLYAFITEQTEYMKEELNLGAKADIGFYDLNTALMKCSSIHWSLMSMYTLAHLEEQKEQEAFNSWYSSKFIEVRNDTNRPELTAQKWASQKEIEHMVRSRYSKEYLDRKNKLLVIEQKTAFVSHMIEVWKAHQFVLNTLSSNIRSEAGMSQ